MASHYLDLSMWNAITNGAEQNSFRSFRLMCVEQKNVIEEDYDSSAGNFELEVGR